MEGNYWVTMKYGQYQERTRVDGTKSGGGADEHILDLHIVTAFKPLKEDFMVKFAKLMDEYTSKE